MSQANLQANPIAQVPHTSAGRITDEHLEIITEVAAKAEDGTPLHEAESILLRISVPQLLRELRQRRAAMDTMSDLMDLDNVHFLPARTT